MSVHRRAAWFAILLPMAVAVVAALSGPAHALEPPTKAQLRYYRANGTLAARIARAETIGNQDVDPGLAAQFVADQTAEARGVPSTTRVPAMGYPTPSHGTVPILVIYLGFRDYPQQLTDAQIAAGLTGGGVSNGVPAPYESLRNYYSRSSGGALTFSGITILRYTKGGNRGDYTGDAEDLVIGVLDYYDDHGMDFTRFDSNHDGVIDDLVVLWTGPDHGWASFWWPYTKTFYEFPYASWYSWDGKWVDKFIWSCDDNSSGQFATRPLIHETGHMLGLPDYYDYDSSKGPDGGVGGFDMMCGSRYGHNAFSRWLLGWTRPYGVTQARYALQQSSSSSFVLWPSTVSVWSQYYIVEYRSRYTPNDADLDPLPGGFAVWHVDAAYDGSDFAYNNSDTSHKLLRLMEADGLEQIEKTPYGFTYTDLYRTGQRFDSTTKPNSNSYGGGTTGVAISGIANQADGSRTIWMSVRGADYAAPIVNLLGVPAGWTNSAVTLNVQATDSYSGVDQVLSRVDGGAWKIGAVISLATPADHSDDGVHTVESYAVDYAGNVSSVQTAQVRIDTTAPQTTCSADTLWHNADITASLTASDSGSGIARTEWDLDGLGWVTGSTLALTALADHSNDGSHVLSYRSTDAAGNVETERSATLNIDTVAPTPHTLNHPTVHRGRRVSLKYRVDDPPPCGGLAGARIVVKTWGGKVVKTVSLPSIATGTQLSYSFRCRLPVGKYHWFVTTTDCAGNPGTRAGRKTLTVVR